jgi:hypothetical protein
MKIDGFIKKIYFLLFFLGFIACFVPAQTRGARALVSYSTGKFSVFQGTVQRNYSPIDIPGEGMALRNDNIFQTEAGSSAIIELQPGGIIIDVGEHSSIGFNQLGTDNSNIINLIYGRVRVTASDGSYTLFVQTGNSLTEIKNGVIHVDYTVPKESINGSYYPLLTVAVFSGGASVVPDSSSTQAEGVSLTVRDMLILDNTNSKYVKGKITDDVIVYWDSTINDLERAKIEQKSYISAQTSAAARAAAENADVDATRLNLINLTGINEDVTIKLKTWGFLVGTTLIIAGIAMQNIIHYQYDTIGELAPTLFNVGWLPISIGSFTLFASIIYNPAAIQRKNF